MKSVLFIFGLVFSIFIFDSSLSATPLDLRWDQLRMLNLKTHEVPAELAKFDGKEVRLLGFIIPFEDGKDAAAEFLLLPGPQSCVHVPPPPPNQIVWVRMKKGTSVSMRIEAFYVEGIFHIMTNDTPVGKVSFYLEGTKVSEKPIPNF